MRLTIFTLLALLLVVVASKGTTKRANTTPSPYGTAYFKLLKCSCNSIAYEYVHENLTCFAKAHSRDVTTISAYGMLKRDVDKVWGDGYIEYKYGTIYREIMRFKKKEGCEAIRTINQTTNPIHLLIYKYAQMNLPPKMIHNCPYKAGEVGYGYNKTFETQYLPSIFNQGQYRGTLFVYLGNPDQLACNVMIVLYGVSPVKESFGRK